MDTITVAVVSLAVLLALLAAKVPIGVALGLVSFGGFWILLNFDVALSTVRTIPYEFSANWDLTAIPMFLLMGAIVNQSGISTALFRAARLWLGGLPGGLAVATNLACAGFGAASGSSVAASATMARLAVPEMLSRQAYGAINGALTAPSLVAMALAPLAAAALWSATGSYDAVLLALIGGATVLALGFWTAAAISRRPGQGVQD